jgi:hypothetical protein
MKSNKFFLASVLATGILAQQPAQAALVFDFNFINTGGLNKGFTAPTLGAARQTALIQSGTLLGAYFSNYNATVKLDVNSEDKPLNNTLASAFSGIGTHGLKGNNDPFRHTVVQQKILNGTDANGAAADGDINWNFGTPGGWALGDSVSKPAFDFKSTAMHEILHAMGFTSSVQAGGQGADQAGPGNADIWNTSDQFLTDKDGNRLIDNGGVFDPTKIGVLTAGTLLDNITPTGNGAFFNGANAKAGNNGDAVNLFSQAEFDSGSSIAHLDDAAYTSDAFLMEASTIDGLGTRTLSALEIGYLKDIGYTQINTSPVPVPAAVWFMGSGLIGLIGMRRKSNIAA